MPSVARVIFIKAKVIFRYHTKGVKFGFYSCSNYSTKIGKKRRSGKTFSGLQNGAIKGLQIGGGFRDYKSGQEGLQRVAGLWISNQRKKITNRGRDFKSRQKDFKSGQRLQIGARRISNRGRDYKLG